MKVSRSGEVGSVGPADTSEPRAPTPLPKRDRVSTERSAEVEKAIALARQSAPAARQAQLIAIEAKIRSGTFKPSPSAIAERLLQAAEVEAAIQAAVRK